MVQLKVELNVKFRAFGITFGNINKKWSKDLPVSPNGDFKDTNIVDFNERGIALFVRVEKVF